MMFPINGDTLAALFLGVILGMFLVALMLFAYGLVTNHIARKRNEQEFNRGLQALRESEQGK
jgi:hypothetical protein